MPEHERATPLLSPTDSWALRQPQHRHVIEMAVISKDSGTSRHGDRSNPHVILRHRRSPSFQCTKDFRIPIRFLFANGNAFHARLPEKFLQRQPLPTAPCRRGVESALVFADNHGRDKYLRISVEGVTIPFLAGKEPNQGIRIDNDRSHFHIASSITSCSPTAVSNAAASFFFKYPKQSRMSHAG